MAISVEGQTERDFVTGTMRDHLRRFDVEVVPVIVTTKRVISGKNHKGGAISIDRAINEVRRLLPNFDFVSTFYDFYGFKGAAAIKTANALEDDLWNAAAKPRHFRPYIQQHEFEALLFSAPDVIARRLGGAKTHERLQAVIREFGDPELINRTPSGAPSKRIGAILPSYQKVAHGPEILRTAGLATIRAKCRRFNEWVSWLEHPTRRP